MLNLLKRQHTPQTPPPGGYDADTCRRLLSEQLDYITKTCEKATGHANAAHGQFVAGEGGHSYLVERADRLDKDELFNQVIDHLKEDDFRRLREFKGQSSFTTYLTAIISRLVVDIVRSRTGRNRAKERAERFGQLGRAVYDAVVQRGHSINEAIDLLHANHGISATREQLLELLSEMQGRDSKHQSTGENRTAWGEDGELVAIEHRNPEDELSNHMQHLRRRELLTGLLEELSSDERLLLRLKFPLDDDEPPDMAAIAVMTNLSEQQVDRKLRRILQRCRELLLKKGVSLNELL